MLLFVCHANICRSAMAERLARLALGPGGSKIVTSAGTHARPGDDMHPGAAVVLAELGADPNGFASRPLTPELITSAGLVLTATREQRAFCVRMAPVALRRTFTIRQFGRLAEAVTNEALTNEALTNGALTNETRTNETPRSDAPHERGPNVRPLLSDQDSALAALLRRMATVRGSLQPVPPQDEDLADPVNGPPEDIRACAHQIQLSLRPVLALIGPG